MTTYPKILIVDDELQSRALVRKLLWDVGLRDTVFESGTVANAAEKIKTHSPDLVFLDVQMKGETGFDLLDRLSQIDFEIIFTTAHSEYAVKAFRYSAMDYLMKPLDTDEFNTAVTKALLRKKKQQSSIQLQTQVLRQQLKSNKNLPEKLTVPTAEGFLFIRIDDILYCHAINNYTEFCLAGGQKIISSHTLGYYDEWLTEQHFFRVHRSYLINLAHIKMYRRGDGGMVTMSDGWEIEVSRNNKEALLKLFKG